MSFDKFLWKSFLPADWKPPAEQMEDSGILLVDKPEGITSMDILRFFKKLGNVRKAGHAGTLDPMATGLMIVLLGKATRLSATLMDGDKEYQGSMLFGQSYDTQDITGKPVGERSGKAVPDLAALNRLCETLTGNIAQIPPVFSAIKKQGRPLYDYARSAREVTVEPRMVKVHRFEITAVRADSADFFVHCGKGVYVRTLVHDLGILSGCNAAMSSLRRLKIGKFSLESATPMGSFRSQEDIRQRLIPPDGYSS